MDDYNVIADVSDTLIQLMDNNQIINSNEVDLSSPEDIGSGKKLSLFLYQITENPYLKNQDMHMIDTNKYGKSPLALSLFYLITSHSPEMGENIKQDHIVIAKILQMINDNPIIRDPFLLGSLTGKELKLILHSISLDELNKLWSIISKSKPFKLSISLEVSPVIIESSKEYDVTRVVQRDLDYSLKEEKRNE
ncbi:MAG TPA: DUF4255 domain-containing protein [Methanobacterium sp.]|nr:DUF4255 domain-containing protein [Methanobacterium sp.]